MQQVAWQISILLMVLIASAFVFVAINSAPRNEDYIRLQKRAYRLRGGFLLVLAFTFGPAMIYTLLDLPYTPRQAANGTVQVIQATGHLWRWELSDTRVEPGRPVEFRVTSADVNHGFGIYDPDLKLVGQVQAMPGYTNTLRLTFDREGTYRILCLEYCGIAHHTMATEITVSRAPAERMK